MAQLRKLGTNEAKAAALKYGSDNEHEFKSHVLGSHKSISLADIFIDTSTREVVIADKDGKNPVGTGIFM